MKTNNNYAATLVQLAVAITNHCSEGEEREVLRKILGNHGVDSLTELKVEDAPACIEQMEAWLKENAPGYPGGVAGPTPGNPGNPPLNPYRVGTPHSSGLTREEEDGLVLNGYTAAKEARESEPSFIAENPYPEDAIERPFWERGFTNFINSISQPGQDGPDRSKETDKEEGGPTDLPIRSQNVRTDEDGKQGHEVKPPAKEAPKKGKGK